MISARWKRNTEPPSLPSELLTLALRDLSWVEEHPTYTISMGSWVWNCKVCFAGAVMARRFKIPDGLCGPALFTKEWKNAFWALDCFRQGYITSGLCHLDIKRAFNRVHVCSYWQGPASFKRSMRNLIILLRREGL